MKQKKTLKLPIFCIIYLAVIILAIAIDLITKWWIYDKLHVEQGVDRIRIVGNLLTFYPTLNDGAAFGMWDGEGANVAFFIITLIGVPLFCWLLLRSRTRSVVGQIAFALIIGGTLGNAYDRAFYETAGTFFSGSVRDFISISFFPAVFNFADWFLTCGVAMAILAIIFFDPDSLVKLYKEEKLAKLTQSQQEVAQPTVESSDENNQPD